MAKKEQEQIPTDDAIVLMFLDLVEKDGVEVQVTLSMNGAIISGALIGPSAYYEGITEKAKMLSDKTLANILSKKFGDLKEAYAKQKGEEEGEEDKETKENSYTFIHLKNAKYLSVSSQPTTGSGTWWRGKISSIDGFSFNSLD